MTDVAPLVSVVMPVFNGARFLREAIDSVRAQTYARWELVVIDDASTDESPSILARYAAEDARIRVFRQPQNQGIVAARNRAFREARPSSTYFAVLDADDVALPHRLHMQVAFLEAHPDHALVGGHTVIIDESGQEVGLRRYPVSYEAICDVIARYNPLAQPTVTIRRSVLDEVGVYDPHFVRCQDYDLWLRIASRHKIANLDEVTLQYRVSSTQGKVTHLRTTLALTLELQRRWLMHPKFFRPFNAAYVAAEHGLQLLPDSAILALFKRATYARLDIEPR